MAQRGEVFRTPGGKWAYRFYDTDGVRRKKSGFDTKGQAREALNFRLQHAGDTHYKPNATVQLIHDAYLETYKPAARTREWFDYHAKKALATFADRHPDDITPDEFRRWRGSLSNEASAHQTHRVFRQVLAQAFGDGWIKTNVAARVKNPAPVAAEVEAFPDWATVEALARELGDGADGSAILIMGVGTGARPEELFGLNWSDVDLAGKTVTFRQVYTKPAKGQKAVVSKKMKTAGSRRTVPLRARVVEALGALPDRRGPVFHGARGARIDLDNWRTRYWEPAFDAAGIPYVKPYAWRHTFATWALDAGLNTFILARRMGTSLAMIDRTYGHLVKDSADAERSMLDAWDVVGGAKATSGVAAFDEAWRMA